MCIVYHTYYHDTLYDSTQAGTNPKKEVEREKSGGGGGGGWWNDKRSWGTYNNVHQKNEVDLAEKLLKNDSGRQAARHKQRSCERERQAESRWLWFRNPHDILFIHSSTR
eukprot:scaffold1067_cov150-Amphora_coffeaeformis.AAC.4